jgi:hypothetical protein
MAPCGSDNDKENVMRGPMFKGALVVLSVGGLLTVGTSPAFAGSPNGEIQQTVHVLGNGSVAHLDHTTIQSGSIRFVVSTTNTNGVDGNGSDITLFQPKPGVSVSRVLHDMQDSFSPNPRMAADGTRESTRDARILGLADVIKGHSEVVTEFVSPGTYYVADIANAPSGPPALTTLIVRPAGADIEQDSDLASQVVVRATSADRFIAPRDWPHQGTYTFANVSDTMHFMTMQPVRPGTTDAQIQAYFDSNPSGPPQFLVAGPTAGNDVLTPGESLQLSYSLPRGTYALLCFVADDVTGMPHAVMGMHKVVVLH